MLSDCKQQGNWRAQLFSRQRSWSIMVNLVFSLLQCKPTFLPTLSADRECIENDVRLVRGGTGDDGQVEMCLSGTWTQVCSDRWSYRPSSVVCRQLGYNGREFRAVPLISL